MGEYHGYLIPGSHPQPVFHVEAVTYRNDPILPVCVADLPPEENHVIWCPMISAVNLDLLRASGLPVAMAWAPPEAVGCWCVVEIDVQRLAALRTMERELSDAIAATLFPSHSGWMIPKIILVGDDVDITDLDQVIWAMATRHHPGTGHYLFPAAQSMPLVPYLSDDEKQSGLGGKSVMSCLWPEQFDGGSRGEASSFRTSFPEEVRRNVMANWRRYGFRDSVTH